MVKANVIPGKFLSCLLGIFIGILLTLGGAGRRRVLRV